MLALTVTISGDKVIIDGLRQLSLGMYRTIQGGLGKAVRGIHREALKNLNGVGGMNSYETRTSKTGKQYQKKTGSKTNYYSGGFAMSSGASALFKRFTDSGGYPVPVRTGNLKRLLDFVLPGSSKGEFSAGPLEAIVYNSAEYARVIHSGTGSSAKFGARPFLTDALEMFNQGGQIAAILDGEIAEAITRQGLS